MILTNTLKINIKKKYRNNNFLILKIIINIIVLSNFFNIIPIIKFFITNIKSENEYIKNEIYLKKCNDNNILKNQIQRLNPEISIISPIFNRENYLLRFLKSICNQNYNNVEIILIDDCSMDNSVQTIEGYQKIDKRILLLKNQKNKGTFISRNLGVLFSKGKYLILPDPDDILSKNTLRILLYFCKKNDYDLIRFNSYLGRKKIIFHKIQDKLEDYPVYQPELSTYIFYGNNELGLIDYYINNKFIKRDIFIEAINTLNIFYRNIYMTYMEDSVINYLIYRTSKSYYFLKKIGYYYIRSVKSITKNLFKISGLKALFIFYYLKFSFEYSKNNKYERDMNNELFTEILYSENLEKILSYLTYNINYRIYKETINKYINNKFIYIDIKKILRKFLRLFKNKEKNQKNLKYK